MPVFPSPEPISATIDLGPAAVRIIATDRADTVVDVRPTDEHDESDVRAAEQVRVDFADGTLRVTGPKVRAFDFSRRTRSVDVTIELPTGSGVTAESQVGDFDGTGLLGESRFKTAAGHVRLDETGPLRVRTGAGRVTVETVDGDADVTTGTGKVELGVVRGTAVVKNSDGTIAIDAITGDVRARTANGDIAVDRAGAGVEAKTSHGAIRLGEVTRGTVVLETGMGDLEVGIAEGTAAWLDVHTAFGRLTNQLDATADPSGTGDSVKVRGNTGFGDVTVHRA